MKEVRKKIDEILEIMLQSFGVEGPNKRRNLVTRRILNDSVKISCKNCVKIENVFKKTFRLARRQEFPSRFSFI